MLRDFQAAYAKLGGNFDLKLRVVPGGCDELNKHVRLGFGGLPGTTPDGSLEPCVTHDFLALCCVDESEALSEFQELSSQAGSFLPLAVRKPILEDVRRCSELGIAASPPSNASVWWMTFLWYQADQDEHVGRCEHRVSEWARVIAWTWVEPFLSSALAIERCGLSTDAEAKYEMQYPPSTGWLKTEQTRRRRKDNKWFDVDPAHDSKFQCGPLTGSLAELTTWIGIDRRTLAKQYGKSSFYIKREHGKKYLAWFSSQSQYANANKNRLDSAT